MYTRVLACLILGAYIGCMTTGFKIESGVPLPERGAHLSKYPFDKMLPGDSFLVPCGDNVRSGMRQTLAGQAQQYKILFGSRKMKWSVRGVEDGVRVWRLK